MQIYLILIGVRLNIIHIISVFVYRFDFEQKLNRHFEMFGHAISCSNTWLLNSIKQLSAVTDALLLFYIFEINHACMVLCI